MVISIALCSVFACTRDSESRDSKVPVVETVPRPDNPIVREFRILKEGTLEQKIQVYLAERLSTAPVEYKRLVSSYLYLKAPKYECRQIGKALEAEFARRLARYPEISEKDIIFISGRFGLFSSLRYTVKPGVVKKILLSDRFSATTKSVVLDYLIRHKIPEVNEIVKKMIFDEDYAIYESASFACLANLKKRCVPLVRRMLKQRGIPIEYSVLKGAIRIAEKQSDSGVQR